MHECDRCGKEFPTERGLNIHRGRFCKGRKKFVKRKYTIKNVLGVKEFYCSYCGKKNYVEM